MFVFIDGDGIAFFLRHRHADNFFGHAAVANRGARALVAAQRERVLIFARNFDILRRRSRRFRASMSVPYFAFSAGLMKRQPIVVSSSFSERENAASDLPTTNGARDMLSTPPAMMISASPL